LGQYPRQPDPFDALRQQAPRTGPPVNNQGGFPPLPPPPQVRPLPTPTVGGQPGPQAGALPAFGPLTSMPTPAGQAPAPVAAPPAATVTVHAPAAPAAAPPQAVQPAAPPAPVPAASTPYRIVGSLQHVPTADELGALGSGMAVSTPHGDIYRDPATGELVKRFNDVGKAAYEQERAAKLRAFGRYPGMDDPRSPAPPVEPGKPSYNPFAPRGQEWS
jgi:hypothetical protein